MSKHDEDNASICISRHTHLCSLVWTMHTTNWQAELSTSIICLLLTTSKAEPWEKMLIYICASTLDTPSSWLFNKYLSNKRIEISLIYQEYSDRVLYDIYCISSEWLTGCKCDSRLSLILKIISPVAFYYIFYTYTHTTYTYINTHTHTSTHSVFLPAASSLDFSGKLSIKLCSNIKFANYFRIQLLLDLGKCPFISTVRADDILFISLCKNYSFSNPPCHSQRFSIKGIPFRFRYMFSASASYGKTVNTQQVLEKKSF